MNNLKIFENEEFGEIRTEKDGNEIWFALADVCKALDLSSPSKVKERLAEKGLNIILTPTKGGFQRLLYINESNLYRTIFQSRKESAERFTDWLTEEVLPAIREKGSYALPQNYETALEQLLAEVKKNNQLALENEELKESVVQMDRVIGEMKPKVDYCDVILSTTECMTTSQVAQDYGMSAKRFNSMLNHLGIQHRISDQWLLYSKYLGKGYTKTRVNTYKRTNGTEGSKPLTVWTQKGRMFLYEELKRYGVLPSMEIEHENVDANG